MYSYNLSILDFKFDGVSCIIWLTFLIIYPYWILNQGIIIKIKIIITTYNLSILDFKSKQQLQQLAQHKPYNLSILDFKSQDELQHDRMETLIIYPYWILNLPKLAVTMSILHLIIYPYWILNSAVCKSMHARCRLIIYPYWILNFLLTTLHLTKL